MIDPPDLDTLIQARIEIEKIAGIEPGQELVVHFSVGLFDFLVWGWYFPDSDKIKISKHHFLNESTINSYLNKEELKNRLLKEIGR
jgi:hypothetical protein